LLVSDESTALVDAEGRREITRLLARLVPQGVTVVHVTHHAEETAPADQVLTLHEGQIVATTAGPLPPEVIDQALRQPAPSRPTPGRAQALELSGVGHVWSARTPWAQRALSGVQLRIEPGEGVVVVGGNGSGKSTLAWILAGLVVPSEGSCTLGGAPTASQVGAVGLAFQHARLQLQRPTVLADVRAAGGLDGEQAAQALRLVGLDPQELGDRSIETLSGGQLRRVALAGILGRNPPVLVLDEPLAGLDTQSRVDVLGVLRRLRSERGTTLVMVSHDLEGVASVCDRTVRLVAGRVGADVPLQVHA
jgi:energy-coupling factor transport system ATP-binding protein